MIVKTRQIPKEGQLKTITRFAWLPVWIEDKKIWLERYKLTYQYVYKLTPPPLHAGQSESLMRKLIEIHMANKFPVWVLISKARAADKW
jgi:hypothetical protein